MMVERCLNMLEERCLLFKYQMEITRPPPWLRTRMTSLVISFSFNKDVEQEKVDE